jgi:hypothetical protein
MTGSLRWDILHFRQWKRRYLGFAASRLLKKRLDEMPHIAVRKDW